MMSLVIVVLFLIYIILAITVLVRVKNILNKRKYIIVVITIVFIPTFDFILSEILFQASKCFYPKSEVYRTAISNEYGAVGSMCMLGSFGEANGSWVDGEGYVIDSIKYSESGLNYFSSVDKVCTSTCKLFSSRVGYVVVSSKIRFFNVVYRRKVVLDLNDCSVMGVYRDVVLLKSLPFFAWMYTVKSASHRFPSGNGFCNFQYKVIIFGR